jgi:hypothetical protein
MRDFIQTLSQTLRILFHGHTLDEIKRNQDLKYYANPHRNHLFQFEQIVKGLRNKRYGTEDLSPELQEWAGYSRNVFYFQLEQMYQRFNYYYDVDRVRTEGQKGTATVTARPDGSETTIDHEGGALSSKVIKHGHTVEF